MTFGSPNLGVPMEIKLQVDDDYCQGNGSCLWTDDEEEFEDTSEKRVVRPKSVKVGRAKN